MSTATELLKQVNGRRYHPVDNPRGLDGIANGVTGMEQNLPPAFNAVGDVGDEVAAAVEQVEGLLQDVQEAAQVIAGTIAQTVPTSVQGKQLVAAATPAAARAVIGAADANAVATRDLSTVSDADFRAKAQAAGLPTPSDLIAMIHSYTLAM